MEFGFLNENNSYTTKFIEIRPLNDINKKIKFLKDNFYIKNGWIYPPIKTDIKGNSTRPVVWYGLPSSHKLVLKISNNKDLQDFIPIFFGFLKGLHMFRDGWGHYYKTPINEGKLIRFYCTKEEICIILDKVINLYKNDYDIFKNYYAAIHWFLFGQSYSHVFEKFDAQYRVLDCCYKISTELNHINRARYHAERIEKLCTYYDIFLPNWAKSKDGKSTLSELRNNLIHEAKYAGEPVGLNSDDKQLWFNLKLINERILLSILGVKSKMFSNKLVRSRYALDWIK